MTGPESCGTAGGDVAEVSKHGEDGLPHTDQVPPATIFPSGWTATRP
jgi:hypothetical protein